MHHSTVNYILRKAGLNPERMLKDSRIRITNIPAPSVGPNIKRNLRPWSMGANSVVTTAAKGI